MSDVTQILSAIEGGDAQAAERLLPLVYEELRKLAAARMAQESPDHTLQATALVHEAYVRLVDTEQAQHWDSRGHFFSAAAEAMRRILIERARKYASVKHGGGRKRHDLEFISLGAGIDPVDVLALDDALSQLAERDERMAQLVKLRFFAGLSIEQAATVLGVTPRTANRDWVAARTWLWRELSGVEPQTPQSE